jgi:hypothetical protein
MSHKKRIDADCLDRWQALVSEANWQKGEVIATYAANDLFDRDGEFVHQVGGITIDYLRALRLVWLRFSDIRHNYPNLRWSHFYTALDWPDAHVWLRKADVDGLNPSQMGRVRFYELPMIQREIAKAMKGDKE